MGPKGRRGLICLSIIIILIVAACLALLFLPCLPPNLPFPEYNATLPRPLVGKQLPKDWLSGAIPVPLTSDSEDKSAILLLGPESLARRGEKFYTGLLGGHLVQLSSIKGKIDVHNITLFGEPCEDISEGAKCGRPMGMRFHSDGLLYVTDAYLGLYKVNVDTGEKSRLAKSHDYVSGKRPSLPNDLDIAKDGTVYWSDASTNVKVEDVVLEFMSEPSGRLLRYDPIKKKSEAIIRRVQCANGVQLSPDEDFVLVAEGGKDRILRYYLKGPKTGTSDVFIDGLPGVPDKIRSSGRPNGGYLVWCIVSHGSARNGGGGGFLPWLRKNRMIRTMLMRGLFLLENIFKNAHDRFGDNFSRKMIYSLGNLAYMGPFLRSEGLVLELDAHGNITGSFFSGDGSVTMASEMHVLPGGRGGIKGLGNIYIGSPVNSHLLQVPIKEGEMLELAMAYSKANTAPENIDNKTNLVNEIEEELNSTSEAYTDVKPEEPSPNISPSITEITSNNSPNEEPLKLEETPMDDPDVEIINSEKNMNLTSELTQLDSILKELDSMENKEEAMLNESSTESLLDSFFATVTPEEVSASPKSLENNTKPLSNETHIDSSTDVNDGETKIEPKRKGLLEDDSGNLVLEDPVLRILLEGKRKGKDSKELESLEAFDQSNTKSDVFNDENDQDRSTESSSNEKNIIALDSIIDITTVTTSIPTTVKDETDQ